MADPTERTELAIDRIYAPPEANIREVDADSPAWKELVRSIESQGIVEPLIVRLFPPEGPGQPGKTHRLVCGFRRLSAARAAKLLVVPVVVRELTDDQAAEVQLTENLQREQLTPMEEAKAVHAYAQATGAKNKEIAKRLSKSETWIRERLALLNLRPKAQELLGAGKISTKVATILAVAPGDVQDAIVTEPEWVEFEAHGEQGVRRAVEHMTKQVAEHKAFQEKVKASKFPKCPKCGKDPEDRTYDNLALCPNRHEWSLATGKGRSTRENITSYARSKGPAGPKIDREESMTLRAHRTPQEILGEYLSGVQVSSIMVSGSQGHVAVVFQLAGENAPEAFRSNKDGAQFHLVPHDFSTGERTQIIVKGYAGPERKKAKAVVRNFLADLDTEEKLKPEKDLTKEIEALLAGERGDVEKRIRKVKDRELLERARAAEVEGECRVSLLILMDQQLEWGLGYLPSL